MSERLFAASTRRVGEAMSRRGSLVTLGVATLIAGLGRPADAARNSDKKARKKFKKKAQQKATDLSEQTCLAQVSNCRESVTMACANQPDPAACGQPLLGCCEVLSTCNATSYLNCIFPRSL